MSIYYLTNASEWASTDNSTLMKVEEMLQRMQTWRNEREFSATDGVDYLAVFSKQAFLIPQLEAIAEDYVQYFDTTIYEVTSLNENIEVKLRIMLQSGVLARTLIIGA